jgi:hypothetical protein
MCWTVANGHPYVPATEQRQKELIWDVWATILWNSLCMVNHRLKTGAWLTIKRISSTEWRPKNKTPFCRNPSDRSCGQAYGFQYTLFFLRTLLDDSQPFAPRNDFLWIHNPALLLLSFMVASLNPDCWLTHSVIIPTVKGFHFLNLLLIVNL